MQTEYQKKRQRQAKAFQKWNKNRIDLPLGRSKTHKDGYVKIDPDEEFRKYKEIPYWYIGKETSTIISFAYPDHPFVVKETDGYKRYGFNTDVEQPDGTVKSVTKRRYNIWRETYERGIWGDTFGIPTETNRINDHHPTKGSTRVQGVVQDVHQQVLTFLQRRPRDKRKEDFMQELVKRINTTVTKELETYQEIGLDKCALIIDDGDNDTSIHQVDTKDMIDNICNAKNGKEFLKACTDFVYHQRVADFVNTMVSMQGADYFTNDKYICVYFNEDMTDIKAYKIVRLDNEKVRVFIISMADIPNGTEPTIITKDTFYIKDINNKVKFDW